MSEMKRGRLKRGRRPKLERPCPKRRLAAGELVRNVVGDRWDEFTMPALDAAVDAVLRHPQAGDAQLLDFLRWFSSDENPMP